MLFTSPIFLFYFFPVAIIIYYALGFSKKIRNLWLFLISLIFYGWAEPLYVFGLLGLIVFNLVSGIAIEKMKNTESKRLLLTFFVIFNVGILFVFKYWNFLLSSIAQIFEYEISLNFGLSIPIGISFFVLRAISYLVDVSKGRTKACTNFVDLGLYFGFFPIIIAGPIISFDEMKDQLDTRIHSFRRSAVGLCRFTVGLAKKIILANSFAYIATRIFDLSTIGTTIYVVPALLAWLGAITFLFQIYFDYSAYCDMAIGLGLIFGFKFPENFNYSISAHSVTQFWKKFNITLFAWFDDYLMPFLSRKERTSKDWLIRNTFILWLVIGLWHGANWTFIVWGILNCVLIILEDFLDIENIKVKPIFLRIYTIFSITLGFVIFRCKDLYQAGIYIGNMFGGNYNGFYSDIAIMYIKEYWIIYILGIIFTTSLARKTNAILINRKWGKMTDFYNVAYPAGMILLFIITLAYIVVFDQAEFIFYR